MIAEFTNEAGFLDQIDLPENLNHMTHEDFMCYFRIKTGINDVFDLEHFASSILGLPKNLIQKQSKSSLSQIINESYILEIGCYSENSFFPPIAWIWRGPSDSFMKTRFKQFGLMDQAINLFLEAEDPDEIKKQIPIFMAAAYTPFGLPWNNWIGNLNHFIFKRIRFKKMAYAAESFLLLRSWLVELYPETFSSQGSSGRDFGFQGIQVQIAGDKFGTVEKAGKARLHDVFTHIEQQIINSNKK